MIVWFSIPVFMAILSLASSQTKTNDWRQIGLNLHNQYRAAHGSAPLTLSNELNNLAQKCAEYLAKNKILKHVCKEKIGFKYADNLALQYNGNPSQAVAESVKMWYDENKLFNYKTGVFSMETGHFTQIVWRNSKKLGIGHYANGNFKVTVGLYDPHGNVGGQFRQNVYPKTVKKG